MGQKVNPISFRTGIYRTWPSRWFSRDILDYGKQFLEDLKIRQFFAKRFKNADIGRIEIEKTNNSLRIILHAARPGVLIGKKGQEMEMIRRRMASILGRRNIEVSVTELPVPDLDAQLVSRSIADQLERRVSFKRAMKKAASTTMRVGAKGVKIRVAGRLGGAEIARDEWVRVGSTPLHTLRADIDYGFSQALTTYGMIGVKVWISKGEYKTAKQA